MADPFGEDPAPIPPIAPQASDCCRGGCDPCVFELFEEEQGRYEAAQRRWQLRRRQRQLPIGDSMSMATARALGFNHVALEVGDIDEALAFYGRLFRFELRSRSASDAFIDLGDQFLALQKGRTQPPDQGRHFGLVVDDKDAVRAALAAAGVQALPGPFLDFLDPWGNRIEIVSYENVQFTKAEHVLRGMGVKDLPKSAGALKELAQKGMAPQ